MLTGFMLCYFGFNAILWLTFIYNDLSKYKYSKTRYLFKNFDWLRFVGISLFVMIFGMVEVLRQIITGELK